MKKSGDSSVGVSRQYCGNLGKVENCQVGVFLAYSKGNKRTLIDFRLYLPENWVEDIASNTQVYLEEPVVGIPEKKGSRGRPPTISKVLNTSPIKVSSLSSLGDGWKLIKVRKTERGNKEVYFKALQVWRRQNELPCQKPLWLLVSKDSKTGEIKHSLCNAAENTSIEKLAEMQSSRYWVERAFQDAKENCGMDEYMVRSWNAWHRHMTMVIIAMLILISYHMKFKKLKVRVSIPVIVEIVKFHNPLKVMNATQLARKLNQDNEMRMKARTSRLRGSEFLEF